MNESCANRTTTAYFIGWDVGGWNCDRNGTSRDAIVILKADLALVGAPWRGNLWKTINEAENTSSWVNRLFILCKSPPPTASSPVVLAIDTPLGFSESFIRLNLEQVDHLGELATNPYLYRNTERFLFAHGLKPLSPVKDMLGSQASKGMHVLAKFARNNPSCGIWTGTSALTVIEAYPSSVRSSRMVGDLREALPSLGHEDKDDALTCALIAAIFTRNREALVSPPEEVSCREGWIWLPKDALKHSDTR